ncbi:SPASM domain-containing protein [Candidatus Parcubacteria bacterium]|nr:SPASM domain-containing protein [Candidatus Parcubacteria bacterium]
MKLDLLLYKFKRVLFFLREKGFKWTWNYIHLYTFYGTKNTFIIKLIHWLQFYPPYLEVEITTMCNLKCIMCEHTYWKEPDRDMSFEQFKKIVDQFPKLKWIGLTGIGESFLNKDFMKMLRYVKSKNIFVELYDNFYFLDSKAAEEFIEMGVDQLFISLDAATKETYEKIRVGSNFERVTNNVRNFIQLKKEKKKYFPEVDFHYIINRLNINEIPQYIELVHSLAGGERTVVRFTRMLHKFKEVSDLFVEVPEEMIQAAEKRAKELGVILTWNRDVPQAKPPISHCTVWLMPFIFVTGHVIPCCSGNEAGNRDFQKATALGNIYEQSFKDIWNGEKYKTLRRMIRENKVPAVCRDCCAFDVKNKT